jgi:tetratricopeptide (TPR) repeat protein
LEPSPLVARQAALTILRRQTQDGLPVRVVAACRQELSSSQRPPVVWIQLWLRELAGRRETLADWNATVEAEASLLKQKSPETSLEIVYALMNRRLNLCNELGLVDETTDALMRLVSVSGEGNDSEQRAVNLSWAMRWIIQHQRWDVLEQVHAQRRDELHGNKRLLYYLAAAVSRSGKADEAAKLAKQAFEMKPDNKEQRRELGGAAAELGFVDWAEREYKQALEELPVVSVESLKTRRDWSIWRHDREDYKGAADVLGEFFDAMKEDRAGRQQLIQRMDGRQYINSIQARHEFYLACYYETRQEYDKQREALERAAGLYDDDPDILIAMYRWKGNDPKFREQTLMRIQEMSQKHLMLIEQYPDEPSLHNQWAWLVSNTVGDYAKAVEHSKRSLELARDEPSYLDTLGRCHFAAGDLENAVKSQRRAVELAPHYQVMRRQLAEFERALAAKKNK